MISVPKLLRIAVVVLGVVLVSLLSVQRKEADVPACFNYPHCNCIFSS